MHAQRPIITRASKPYGDAALARIQPESLRTHFEWRPAGRERLHRQFRWAVVSGKILIVEDEAVTALDLEEMLVGYGYRVVGVGDSAEHALELVEREMPDLALLDITIAGSIDGIVLGSILQQSLGLDGDAAAAVFFGLLDSKPDL